MTFHKQIEDLEEIVQENKRASVALQEILRTKFKEYEDMVPQEVSEMKTPLSETPI